MRSQTCSSSCSPRGPRSGCWRCQPPATPPQPGGAERSSQLGGAQCAILSYVLIKLCRMQRVYEHRYHVYAHARMQGRVDTRVHASNVARERLREGRRVGVEGYLCAGVFRGSGAHQKERHAEATPWRSLATALTDFGCQLVGTALRISEVMNFMPMCLHPVYVFMCIHIYTYI